MHYQIIYYKVISDAPVSQVRKATGCREVGDSIDGVIADRISFGGECEASKIALWVTKRARLREICFSSQRRRICQTCSTCSCSFWSTATTIFRMPCISAQASSILLL